ncbi:MAG: RNA polymerase sigma factor, partial [Steroidobacteraceae bacterium]
MIEREQNDEQEPDPVTQPAPGSRQHSPDPQNDPRNRRLVAWFKRWRKPIRQWLSHRSSVPSADLDDLAQEVFLRLLRYSDDVAIDNPQGYLFRIAANVANEWQERARHRKPHDDSWLEDLQVEFNDEPENAIAREMAHKHMQAAVNRLPRRQREVLLLHVNEGLTYKQIAQRQGRTYRV